MADWEVHMEVGKIGLHRLKSLKQKTEDELQKCSFWEIKKKKSMQRDVEYFTDRIERLGNNPSSFDLAMNLPDGLLRKLGF